jgi:hypothetical protein
MGRECGTQGAERNTYIVSVEKPKKRMRWVVNVARTGVERKTYKVAAKKNPEEA